MRTRTRDGRSCTPDYPNAERTPISYFDKTTERHVEVGAKWTGRCTKCGGFLAWEIGNEDDEARNERRAKKREAKQFVNENQISLLGEG